MSRLGQTNPSSQCVSYLRKRKLAAPVTPGSARAAKVFIRQFVFSLFYWARTVRTCFRLRKQPLSTLPDSFGRYSEKWCPLLPRRLRTLFLRWLDHVPRFPVHAAEGLVKPVRKITVRTIHEGTDEVVRRARALHDGLGAGVVAVVRPVFHARVRREDHGERPR